MPRVRTTKAVAKRIDLTYYNRWHPFSLTRRILVIACFVVALGWWAFGYFKAHAAIYNPGPVDAVHAMWASRCEVCHDKNGRFFETVTDSACLKCHDGAIHHPNQVSFVGTGPNNQKRSASCTDCHTEHRGHAALAGTSDFNCTRCHAELASHDAMKSVPLGLEKVTAFEVKSHPPFGLHPIAGSSLSSTVTPAGNGLTVTLKDITSLGKFWHDEHHVPKKADNESDSSYLSRLSTRCVRCHEPLQPSPLAATRPADPPGKDNENTWLLLPSLLSTDGPKEWAAVSQRYTRPVNYERHCAICHGLDFQGTDENYSPSVPSQGQLPHVSLEILAPAIKRQVEQVLAAPDLKFTKKGTGRRRAQEIPEAQWLSENATAMLDSMKTNAPESYKAKIDEAHAQAEKKVDREGFERLYVAYIAFLTCTKCHGLTGDLPPLSADAPAAKSSFGIAPTGITSQPRRWFGHSEFDHAAHRNLNCLECHDQRPTVRPEPDPAKQPASVGYDVKLPTIATCVQCHQPRSASTSCVTCHVFHDRSRERRQNGPFTIQGAKEGGPVTMPEGPTSMPSGEGTPPASAPAGNS